MIESYSHSGPGYMPFLIREGWQVAQLNYSPELAADALNRLERHNATDEVFIGLLGRSILVSASEAANGLTVELCPMTPGLTYNVPAGAWHAIVMWPDDRVLIVENAETHLKDVEYRDLTEHERERLKVSLERYR